MNQAMKIVQWVALAVICIVIITYVLLGTQMFKPVNILDALRDDHHIIRELIGKTWARKEVFPKLRARLQAHQKGEEAVVYSALEASTNLRKEAMLASEEHRVLEFLLEELAGTSKNDERWEPRFEVLGEYLEHHFRKEENKIFPKAAEILDQKQAGDMGRDYERQKHILLWREMHSL